MCYSILELPCLWENVPLTEMKNMSYYNYDWIWHTAQAIYRALWIHSLVLPWPLDLLWVNLIRLLSNSWSLVSWSPEFSLIKLWLYQVLKSFLIWFSSRLIAILVIFESTLLWKYLLKRNTQFRAKCIVQQVSTKAAIQLCRLCIV